MRKLSRRQSVRARAALGAAVETLESRRMLCSVPHDQLAPAPSFEWDLERQFVESQQLSGGAEGGPEAVGIIWTNRNTLSGADDNFFDDVFGNSRAAAQAVVDAALAAWSRVITSFNRGDGTSTLQISITMNRDGIGNFVGGFGGAGAPAGTAPADGKPRTGSITVNGGNLSADPNDDNGWFLDPTPNDYSEFQGTILTPFAANQTTSIGSDLYSLVTAEVTHCLGLISPKPGISGFSGYRLETSGFTHFTGQADNAEGGGNKGFFYTFDGPTIDHLMTSYNSGDTDADSWGNVIHTAGGTGNISFNAVNWRGTEDDGNAIYDVERLLPSHVTATILKDAYGYSIDPPAKFGSMYSVLDSVTGILNVRGADNSNDTITLTRNGSLLTVAVDILQEVPGSHNLPGTGNAPAWTTEYNLAAVSAINVFPRTGNDTVLISADMGTLPVVVNDTGGTDKLQIQGGPGSDSFSTPNSATVVTTNGQVAYTSMETLEIYTGDGNADVDLRNTNASSVRVTGGAGAQTINFAALDSSTPTIIDLGDGSDVLNFGTASLAPPVGSPVTVFGGVGDDVINLAPSNFASVTISQPVTVFGDTGNDTLVLGSNNADSVDTNIVFDGGTHAGPTGDRVVINDTAVPYNVSYTVSNTVVTRDGFNLPHTISYSNTEGIVLNCGSGGDTLNLGNAIAATVDMHLNDGNDILNVGGGNLTGYFPQIFNGGNGNDRITFDNHLDATNRIWDMRNNEVIFGGLISLFTTNFESVGVLGGTGFDEFDFKGTLVQGFNVDGGGGGDDFVLGYQGSVLFNNAVTLTGGAGPDLYTVNDAAVSTSTAPLVMDAGSATEFNGLVVNEPLATGYDLGLGYFTPRVGASTKGTFNFSGMTSHTITGTAGDNDFQIYSAGASIGTFTIDGGSGNDSFVLVPLMSGYSFKGLTINGQPGTDGFYVNANGLTTNENYTIGTNQFSIQRGAVTETVTITSMNSVNVTCGFGNDTISMNQYSAGIPVVVDGNFGDDTMNVGGGNLSANITSIAAFTFNGQPGFDRFNLNNASEPGAWQYVRDTGTIRSDRLTAPIGYFIILGESSVEEMTVNAGPAGDAFYPRATGTSLVLNAGAGLDGMVVADSTQNLQGIQGLIRYNAGVDGGNMRVSDNADATGDVGHLTATTLGAFPGDNLFGPGGRLEFSDIVNFGAFPGITLDCSSSADTIYATPLASARVTINGGNPPAATGDVLNLALGAAVGYAINGTLASGNVTSTNLQTLNWTGFETGPNIDAVAPAAVGFDLDLGGAAGPETPQSISAFFDEGVLGVTAASLSLVNTTTGQTVPASDITVSANFDTFTFTFPNYPGGALPDGAYHAQILGAGITDLFGNAVSGNSDTESFIWSAGTSGNDVYRVIRDPGGFNHLVYLNDDVTPAFFTPVATTSRIVLAGGDGDDSLTVDFANGNLGAPLYDLKFYGGAGSDTLGVVGSTADDHANYYDGSLQLNGSEINYVGAEIVTYDTGGGAYDTFTINEIAVTLVGSQRFANLTINAGAAALTQSGSESTLVARQLTMAPTALLDLADNDLLIDANSGLLRGGGNSIAEIQALINSARNGGLWDGFGITSSSARDASPRNTTLGAMLGSEFKSVYGASATFNDQAITDGSILVKYTYYGDSDFNGVVNFDDYSRTDAGFNGNKSGWLNGDFDGNGVVNFDDYSLIDLAFNTQGEPFSGGLR